MSFYTALSGLKAAQTDMSSISHNLANVSTNGFKKSRAEFADIISSSVSLSPTQMMGSGTVVKANRQQFGQGNLVQSASSLDLAISGDGFFAVKPNLDGQSVNYTRNGAFLVDANQFVVDGQGNHLQVYPVDGSGTVVATGADSLTSLRLPATSGEAKATTSVGLTATLDAKSAIPATADFDRFDPTSYNRQTVTTVYDSAGNPMTMTNYFKRTSAAVATTPPAAPDLSATWEVFSFVGDEQMVSGAADRVQLTFSNTGALTAPTAATQFDVFTPSDEVAAQQISLNFGAATNVAATPFKLGEQLQDGVAVGQLQGVTVDEGGLVKASFSNGDVQTLGQVAVANFANPSGLRQLGNSTWSSTGVSGQPVMGAPGERGAGNLMSGVIERSNVDITEELVGLIAAQRNFQANAKALDTSSQISQTIFNIRA
jgi:flagellar hook protein FlgE